MIPAAMLPLKYDVPRSVRHQHDARNLHLAPTVMVQLGQRMRQWLCRAAIA